MLVRRQEDQRADAQHALENQKNRYKARDTGRLARAQGQRRAPPPFERDRHDLLPLLGFQEPSTTFSITMKLLRPAARAVALTPHSRWAENVRQLSRSSATRDASQPAPPTPAATATPNHIAQASGGEDARSRLAKLQAQRLEELNRGRSGALGGAGKSSKPEQRWSNRTLIALATSVGACTYLMGTYHGYNAGKAHALELHSESGGLPPVAEAPGATARLPAVAASGNTSGTGRNPQVQTSSADIGLVSQVLLQLIPAGLRRQPIQCEQKQSSPARNCRLAELTQWHCDYHDTKVICTPIDRIFRV